MKKLKSINIFLVIAGILVLISGSAYYFMLEKQRPSSIDDFIISVKKSKYPSAANITSEDLKKLKVTKVEPIETKDPFAYSRKSVKLPKPVSEVTVGLSMEDIKFVGILKTDNNKFAILQLPDNRVYKFVEGDYITKDAAKIYAINDSQMVLLVTTQDARGSWITDKIVLKLEKKEKENL